MLGSVLGSVLGGAPGSEADQGQTADANELKSRRAALKTLATMKSETATEILSLQLDRLETGRLAPGLQLDVMDACKANGTDSLAQRIASITAKTAAAATLDPLAAYRACLEGGDEKRGGTVFREHLAGQCMRCHRIRPQGKGGEAGPPLAGIGKRRDREFLLRALIEPSKEIADGYGTVVVMTKDGGAVAGVLKQETNTTLTVLGADGKSIEVAKTNVASRTQATSAMPPVGALMSKRELRDLVEFLATRK